MRAGRWLLLVMCLSLNACASIAAHYIETPGHHGPEPVFRQWLAENTGYTPHNFVTDQRVRIAYWYSPPTRLDIAPRIEEQRYGKKFSLSFHFDVSKPKHAAATPPLRGSVVLLHPWGQNALQMAFWGVYFSNAGYVTVLPALRSQGESGDAPVGYGPREAGDIVQLVHDLQRRHELPSPLYLFGVSYGGGPVRFPAAA